jgi:hypothetical protein
MVAKRHKITNVPLFKKKIMSRIFLNSGTLIVIKFCFGKAEVEPPSMKTKY